MASRLQTLVAESTAAEEVPVPQESKDSAVEHKNPVNALTSAESIPISPKDYISPANTQKIVVEVGDPEKMPQWSGSSVNGTAYRVPLAIGLETSKLQSSFLITDNMLVTKSRNSDYLCKFATIGIRKEFYDRVHDILKSKSITIPQSVDTWSDSTYVYINVNIPDDSGSGRFEAFSPTDKVYRAVRDPGMLRGIDDTHFIFMGNMSADLKLESKKEVTTAANGSVWALRLKVDKYYIVRSIPHPVPIKSTAAPVNMSELVEFTISTSG